MRRTLFALLTAGACLSLALTGAFAQAPKTETNPELTDAIARIRDEGLNRSQVMETLSYLTEVIGPRLTGSPNLKRANEWTGDKLASWGLTNAHLEAWGPFGRGWSLKRFSAQIVEPQALTLIGYPKAWSPGLDQPIVAHVVYLDARANADLEKYRGELAGAIVLNGPVRELKPRFEPLASRRGDTNLLQMANAEAPRANTPSYSSGGLGSWLQSLVGALTGAEAARPSTNAARFGQGPGGRPGPRGSGGPQARFLSFLAQEKAALVVSPSPMGDGGTVFVSGASVPTPESPGSSPPTNTPRVWATNAPPNLPQITLATEDYNRLVRMLQQGAKLKMAVELQVQFQDQDLMAYNTIAEIPGTDLKDQIVMLGAHMDSWHAGTGATDNGAGVAATMEAVRILAALKLAPRRTIRLGLWSGEEQGLLGSRAYVARHFGYYTNVAAAATNLPSPRRLVRQPEYAKLSAYFNLDNGAGKIRGVYLQGNEAVRPLFRRWLEPFHDLGAETLTLSNTGGTDHTSFDAIGLPGFQFIQDPLDYSTRTHHSNEDVFDRVVPDDLKQAAVILAAFAYHAATLEEPLPRKGTD